MADNLDILREKLQQLHEDYHSLKNHFDMDYAQGADIVLDTTYTNGARFVFTLPK